MVGEDEKFVKDMMVKTCFFDSSSKFINNWPIDSDTANEPGISVWLRAAKPDSANQRSVCWRVNTSTMASCNRLTRYSGYE